MAYWLLKTEPSSYSYDDLERDRETRWDGVRNATALQNIRKMRLGDICVVYHTGDERTAIGLAEVISEPHPDPEGDSDKWAVVDVRATGRLDPPVKLEFLKGHPQFVDSPLLRISRLSVVPLTDQQFQAITG
jgi:predicted RNA-binding protein with PUA-like domain